MSHKIPRFAFPVTQPGQVLSHGMTLRDYMAGQAIAGLLASHDEDLDGWDWPDYAVHAYRIADAMLDARCHEEVTERVGSDHG